MHFSHIINYYGNICSLLIKNVHVFKLFWNFSASSIIHIINKRRQKSTHLHCSLFLKTFLFTLFCAFRDEIRNLQEIFSTNPSHYSFVTCNKIYQILFSNIKRQIFMFQNDTIVLEYLTILHIELYKNTYL